MINFGLIFLYLALFTAIGTIVSVIVCTVPRLVSYAHRPKIDSKKTLIKPDYWKIARLEIELLGETKYNDDSPVPSGAKTVGEMHGVDSTGHLKDGSCNLNAALGPACTKMWHRPPRRAQIAKIKAKYAYGVPNLAINPYADREYDDPNWIDDDGRPW